MRYPLGGPACAPGNPASVTNQAHGEGSADDFGKGRDTQVVSFEDWAVFQLLGQGGEVPTLGPFLASLGCAFRPVVAHAEEFHDPGHVFRLSNVVAHDARESNPVWLRPALGDQLVVDLPREREVRCAGVVVDVSDLPTAEPVDGGW